MGIIKHSQSSQNSTFGVALQNLKKEVRDAVDFLHADECQSSLQDDFNTLGIKISCKVVLTVLMGIFKHTQSTQSNGVRDGIHSSHADKYQSFYNLALSILMEVARHVQSIQIKKLAIS